MQGREMQPKVYIASVLLPSNEVKEKTVTAHQGELPVCRRCAHCSSNGQMKENVVSAAFAASTVSSCVAIFSE